MQPTIQEFLKLEFIWARRLLTDFKQMMYLLPVQAVQIDL